MYYSWNVGSAEGIVDFDVARKETRSFFALPFSRNILSLFQAYLVFPNSVHKFDDG
jgi:hypothetical protein